MGRSLQKPVAKVGNITFTPPVSKGGTGANNRVSATSQLGLISRQSLGLNSGVARIEPNGAIPASAIPSSVISGPTLEGPTEIFVSRGMFFRITNFDQSATYNVSASAGTISRNNAVINYTPPATVQTVTITVNNRTMSFNLRDTAPLTPSISSPVFNANNLVSGFVATSSMFSLSFGVSVHQSSDWQLSTDPFFTNIVSSAVNDTVNRTSWMVGSLLENTQYFIRVRYRDNASRLSSWSEARPFRTRVSFSAYTEQAVISHNDRATGDNLGGTDAQQIAISQDGSRLVISSDNKTGSFATQGAVYVFVRAGNTWTQEAKLMQTGPTAVGEFFGSSLAIDHTGTRVLVGSPGKTDTQTNQGAVYVFTRSGTTWAQEARIYAGDPAGLDRFGWSVSMNSNCTRFVASAFNKSVSTTNDGAIYIFNRAITTWTQEARIVSPVVVSGTQFGSGVHMSADGNRIAVSARQSAAVHVFVRMEGGGWLLESALSVGTYTAASNYAVVVKISDNADRVAIGLWGSTVTQTSQGVVLVYSRTGSVWSQEAVVSLTTPAVNDQFGSDIAFNSDASVMIVGASRRTVTVSEQGAAFVYVRAGTTWTLRNTLVASNPITNSRYGASVAVSDNSSIIAVGAGQFTFNTIANSGAGYIYA